MGQAQNKNSLDPQEHLSKRVKNSLDPQEHLSKRVKYSWNPIEHLFSRGENSLDPQEHLSKRVKTSWGPQKHLSWRVEEVQRLKEAINAEGPRVTVILVGQVGHGKSSLCNGFMSALSEAILVPSHHVTEHRRSFSEYKCGRCLLVDMPGITESEPSAKIQDILSGKYPFHAKHTEVFKIEDLDGDEIIPFSSHVSCVVLVMRYDVVPHGALKKQLQHILSSAGKGEISFHMVLTHLDICDPQFRDPNNLPNVYQSQNVQNAVAKMSRMTGIPPYAISFVSNYTCELEPSMNTRLMYLRVLERIILSADDQMGMRSAGKRMVEMYTSN